MYVAVRRRFIASRDLWIRRPHLTSATVAIAVGVGLVILFKLRGRGLESAAGVEYGVIFAIACLGAIFIDELIRPARDRGRVARVVSAFLALGLSFVTVILSMIVSAFVVPDPAVLYFHLRRSYIQSHWQTDEASGLSYFPLDDNNFFVWDRNKRFVVDPRGSEHLISPRCQTAKYSARLLEGQIYIVFRYIDDPDEASVPCLITPSQKQPY
jgi:hypothetical protein